MKVVLVVNVEHRRGEIIERDKGEVMVLLRNLLLDQFEHDDYVVTTVPEFYS